VDHKQVALHDGPRREEIWLEVHIEQAPFTRFIKVHICRTVHRKYVDAFSARHVTIGQGYDVA
jgi:hypothetical protein